MRAFWWRFKDAGIAMLLLFAALNASSYFVRSTRPRLLNSERGHDRIGFPLLVWSEDGHDLTPLQDYGVWSKDNEAAAFYPDYLTVDLGVDGVVSYSALLANLSCVLGCAVIMALFAGIRGAGESAPCRRASPPPVSPSRPPQFSLRGLFIATTIVALAIGLDRISADRTRAAGMAAIYLLGPAMLAIVAALSRRRSWRGRMFALWITLTVLLSGAVVMGVHTRLGDFTRVLLGLFVFWTPQCALACAIIVGWRTWQARYRRNPLSISPTQSSTRTRH